MYFYVSCNIFRNLSGGEKLYLHCPEYWYESLVEGMCIRVIPNSSVGNFFLEKCSWLVPEEDKRNALNCEIKTSSSIYYQVLVAPILDLPPDRRAAVLHTRNKSDVQWD